MRTAPRRMKEDKFDRDMRINTAWMLRGRDVIAPEHQMIHVELERWGRWNREVYLQGMCLSIESEYDSSGGRVTKRAVIALPVDPLLRQLECAVLVLPEQHRESIEEYYVKRWAPKTICWSHAIQFEDFARWMYGCRQGVINVLALEPT
jgi:hypothetical protein